MADLPSKNSARMLTLPTMTRDELREIWRRLRQIREQRGIPQERLARIAGVRVDALRAAEQGRASGRRTVERVRAALEGER